MSGSDCQPTTGSTADAFASDGTDDPRAAALIALGRAAYDLMENSAWHESEDHLRTRREDIDRLGVALEALDELPKLKDWNRRAKAGAR